MSRPKNRYHRILPVIAALLALQFALSGCDRETPAGSATESPDVNVAASLSAPAKTAATIGETFAQMDLLASPLAAINLETSLYQEAGVEGWDDHGIGLRERSVRTAEAFRAMRLMNFRAAAAPEAKAPSLERFGTLAAPWPPSEEPGDTIYVEYFDGPDSTGLNAVIWVDPPRNLVRFVSRREYVPILGRVVRRDREIVFDTQGTMEDGGDDEYYRFFSEEEMFGGEVSTGTMAPVSGDGPMLPGVEVRAVWHVEDPRFHPLQEWTESVFQLDLGEFGIDGDESIFSIEATVHWRSDAEHRAVLEVPGGGPIADHSLVEARGAFTAAPANPWLQSIADTLRVLIGELEDGNDDLLVEMRRTCVFDGSAVDGGSPRSSVHYLPDEPVAPGHEPCGAEAEEEVWYPQAWWLVHLLREIDVACDAPDTLHLLMEYRDGSRYERWVIWDESGNATVTEERIDGTVVSGGWNPESGEYFIVTTYPTGHDPIAREQHGRRLEGILEAWDIRTWQDGHPDTTYFEGTGDGASFSASGFRVDGDARETFTLEYQEPSVLTGTWERNDGAHGDFTLEELEGVGRHLVFAAEDPHGEGSPRVDGEAWLAPDGSGTGTVTITQYGTTVTYTITFGPDGTAALADEIGNTLPIG